MIVSFQSTPPVAGRRCLTSKDSGRFFLSFNPRLPLPGGDAAGVSVAPAIFHVSIHASRCREAMQPAYRHQGQRRIVSIHASLCREAMRYDPSAAPHHFPVSIHASRCREAMQ